MKTHQIKTIQDIANATDADNIDNFLADLKGVKTALFGLMTTKEILQ